MYCPACGHLNLPGNDACERCLFSLANVDGPAAHDRVGQGLMTGCVAELGPKDPVTVPLDAELGQALRLMIDRGVGAVLVTGPGGELAGILTERDVMAKAAGEPGFESLPVADLMTARPETVAPTDTLAFALGKMDAGGYRHLPVVDGGRPVGVVSVRDILRHVTGLCGDV